MRIGIFTDDFLPRESGVVTAVLQLRKGLIERGHEVYIIAPFHPNCADTIPGVIRLPSMDTLVFPKVRAAVPRARYTRAIEALDLDVIHSMTQFNVGLYADYMARRIGVPHVTTAHTVMAELVKYYPGSMIASLVLFSQLYHYYFGDRLSIRLAGTDDISHGVSTTSRRSLPSAKKQIWRVQNLFLNHADYVITPSEHTLQDFRQYGLRAPASPVPNGIDAAFFKPEGRRKARTDADLHVVTVGRLSGEKRQDTLIRAVAAAKGVRLTVVGDGPSRGDYERLAYEMCGGDQNRITFVGAQSQVGVREALWRADIFALASYNFDTQGLVLIEAAAAGLPVAYCDPKLSESVSLKASFLVEPTPKHFAALFRSLAEDPDELHGMRSHALRFASKFTYLKYAKQTEAIYKRVLSGVSAAE